MKEKRTLESDIQDLLSQKQDLDVRLKESKEEVVRVGVNLKKENKDRIRRLLGSLVSGLKIFYLKEAL